ncbi:MAG: glycosyltransferase family 39 protein [Deltaproteobacteria bacterium]|nr:glycosyltransferase family 39 protein [Deltaproteobacteria bacterium]
MKCSVAHDTVPSIGEATAAPRAARFTGCLWLWAAAFLVSMTMCGPLAVYDGFMMVRSPDGFDALTLAASAAEAIREGGLPARVSGILGGGLGIPYHQFSPPLSQLLPGAVFLLTGNLSASWVFSLILMSALGFVFTWKTCRLLTRSPECAAAGAVLFVTAPWLLVTRAWREAAPECYALCLVPAALYFCLRTAAGGRLRHWLGAALSSCCLFMADPLSALSFTVVLWALLLLCGVSRDLPARAPGPAPDHGQGPGTARDDGGVTFPPLDTGPEGDPGQKSVPSERPVPAASPPPPRKAAAASARRCQKRALLAACAIPAGALLDLWHLGPVLLSRGLGADVAPAPWAPGASIPFMTLLGSWPSLFPPPGGGLPAPYQAGAMLTAGLAALAWFAFRDRGRRFARALALASAFALALSLLPGVTDGALAAPLTITFPARPLSAFAGLAAVSAALALGILFRRLPRLGEGGRRATALAVAAFSVGLAAPYLKPVAFADGLPLVSSGEIILENRTLSRRNYFPLLAFPPEGASPPPLVIPAGISPFAGKGTPGDRLFRVDLAAGAGARNGAGDVVLDVPHYPGLQEISVRVDGAPYPAAAGTYWQRRPGIGDGPDDEGMFHGLLLAALPDRGILEARVRFTGSAWSNRANLIAGAAFLSLAAFCLARGRRPRPMPGGTPGQAPERVPEPGA